MKRTALGVVVGLIVLGASVLTFALLRPTPVQVVELPDVPDPPAPSPAQAPTPPEPAPPVPAEVSFWLPSPPPPAAAITPDGWQVVAAVTEYGKQFNGPCEFSGLVWRDPRTGAEAKRLELRKHLDPASVDRKPGPFGEETTLQYHRLLFAPSGKLLVAGGLSWPDPVKTQWYRNKHEHLSHASSIVFVTAECYSASGFLWMIDPDSGEVEKTLVRDRVDFVRDIDLSRDGTKLLVRMPLPPRTHVRPLTPADEPPFVEVQQWDTTAWTRDWVKMLDQAEADKVRAGR